MDTYYYVTEYCDDDWQGYDHDEHATPLPAVMDAERVAASGGKACVYLHKLESDRRRLVYVTTPDRPSVH